MADQEQKDPATTVDPQIRKIFDEWKKITTMHNTDAAALLTLAQVTHQGFKTMKVQSADLIFNLKDIVRDL